MVKVEMKVNTAYQGPRKVGDTIDVPESFAKRWEKNGIAKIIGEVEEEETEEVEADPVEDVVEDLTETEATEEPVEEAEPVEETEEVEEVEDDDEGIDYSSMKASDLYKLCKERGIDIEAKLTKAAYIEALETLDAE